MVEQGAPDQQAVTHVVPQPGLETGDRRQILRCARVARPARVGGEQGGDLVCESNRVGDAERG